MKRRTQPSTLIAPFLKSVELLPERIAAPHAHPFNLPVLTSPDFRIDFTRRVTIIAGPNGSGKSTIIEAIAALCGFPRQGGSRDFALGDQGPNPLADALRPAWLPRVNTGLFLRAEGFAGFVQQVDDLLNDVDNPGRHAFLDIFGGRSGTERSHGEGYLELFRRRLTGRGLYLFDEPEAALSPTRQLEFLRTVREAERRGDAQFIIATHSPMLMAYPGATLLHLSAAGPVERSYLTTEHFQVLRDFYQNPEGFMHALLPD